MLCKNELRNLKRCFHGVTAMVVSNLARVLKLHRQEAQMAQALLPEVAK